MEEKEKEQKTKTSKAGVILAIIAIIIALFVASSGAYTYYSGRLKGEPGLSIKGEKDENIDCRKPSR